MPSPVAPTGNHADAATALLPATEWLTSALAGVLGVGLLAGGLALPADHPQPPLLIAPMVGNLDDCLLQDAASAQLPMAFRPRPASCNGPQGSAAELLTQTLQPLAPKADAGSDSTLRLGYTLNLPLMRMLEPVAQPNGGVRWVPNPERIARHVRTLAHMPHPAVLYLFGTHFGVNAAAEAELVKDPANLAHTQQGPLPIDQYLDYRIHPWSVADLNNGITHARLDVVREVARQVCANPVALRNVVGVSLLGEVHQLYPQFETGMGFESAYWVGDYSPASQAGFRQHLARRFGRIDALNAQLGSHFRSFDEVSAPSKDIRRDRLNHFFEHIDAFAHGTFPVSGWVHVPAVERAEQAVQTQLAQRPWVQVLLNGRRVARVQASLSRQDVAQAHPLWRTADVGWRHDLAFDHLPAGTHRVDVLLELPQGQLAALATRHVHVMSAAQTPPVAQPMAQALPPLAPLPTDVSAYVDWPREAQDVYFNPLVVLWHGFRERQVTRYLDGVRKVIAQTCLAQKPTYVHQLYPHGNPGWDASRYALDHSLQARSAWRVGVSLYGESAYGERIGRFGRDMRWPTYGITEFHPMRPMTGHQLGQVFAMHRAQGARFLSFFMEAHLPGSEPQRMHNAFSFDPHNPESGSDALYRAAQETMAGSVVLSRVK